MQADPRLVRVSRIFVREILGLPLWMGPGRVMRDTSSDNAEVLPYDFREPSRIAPDRQSRLEVAHEQLAETVARWVKGRLRVQFDFSLDSISQVSYRNFVDAMSDPVAAFVYRRGSSALDFVTLTLEPSMGFRLLERMSGGTPIKDPPDRVLTRLEAAIIRIVLDRIVAAIERVWADYADLALEFARFESAREMIESAEVDEDLLVVSLKCAFDESEGLIQYALPLRFIDRFLDAEQDQRTQARQRLAPDAPTPLHQTQQLVRQAQVTAVARLPSGDCRLDALSKLRVGDILPTDVSAATPVEVWIEGTLRFRGQQGRIGENLAIHLTDVVQNQS